MSQVVQVARTHMGESGTRISLKDALAKAQQPPTKEEIAAKKTRYRQEHREEIAAKKTRYRQEHREEIAAKQTRYRQEHREEIAAKQTRYRQEHREEIAAKKTRYRQEHREEYNTYMRDYMRTRAAQRKSAGAES